MWLLSAIFYTALNLVGESALDTFQQAIDRQQWAHALKVAPQLQFTEPSRDLVLALFDIHRALYESGRLGDEQFAFPQKQGFPMLPADKGLYAQGQCVVEVMLDLGHVNYAERWAYESMELGGERPRLLATLALIHRLKGQSMAAHIYFNRLRQDPTQEALARHVAQWIDDDAALRRDAQAARAMTNMVITDRPGYYLSTEALLFMALQANSQNRMAFEYLMAHYLVEVQLDKFAGLLPRLGEFKYEAIPRHYEEALLLAQHLHPGKTITIPGKTIRPETRARFASFLDIQQKYHNDSAMLRVELEKELGATYWYYYVFSESASYAAFYHKTP